MQGFLPPPLHPYPRALNNGEEVALLRLNRSHLTRLVLVIGLVLMFLIAVRSRAEAQAPRGYIEALRSFPTSDYGLRRVAGMAYSPAANTFFMLEGPEFREQPGKTRIASMLGTLDPVGVSNIAVSVAEGLNVTFDSGTNRLVLFNQFSNELITVATDAEGRPDPSEAAVSRLDAAPLGIERAQGMSFDPTTGRIYLLDAPQRRLVYVTLDSQGRLDGPEARTGVIDLRWMLSDDLRGVAINPRDGTIFVLSPSQRMMVEFTETGQVISTRDTAPLGMNDPQSILIAASSDPTDDPATMRMYAVDSPSESRCMASTQIFELLIEEQAPLGL